MAETESSGLGALQLAETKFREYVGAIAARATEADDWRTAVPSELHRSAESALAVYNGRPSEDVVTRAVDQLRAALLEVVLDKERLVELFEDPLADATRGARRNLDATSSAVLVGSCFAHGDITLFGLTVSISTAIAVALGILLGYHVIAFYLYQSSDRRRFELKRDAAADYVSEARKPLREILVRAGHANRIPAVAQALVADVLAWRAKQTTMIDRYESDVRLVRVRSWWEFVLPFVLAGGAALALVIRGFSVCGLLPLR